MRCPFCKADDDRVIDSRASNDGFAIRRRRQCLACDRRFTTYERIEESPLRVVKKDESREPFERRKILLGMIKACEKRPIPIAVLESVVEAIENRVLEEYDTEVPVQYVGQLVMDALKEIDQVAYVRFASVYREFEDITDFAEELKAMTPRPADARDRQARTRSTGTGTGGTGTRNTGTRNTGTRNTGTRSAGTRKKASKGRKAGGSGKGSAS